MRAWPKAWGKGLLIAGGFGLLGAGAAGTYWYWYSQHVSQCGHGEFPELQKAVRATQALEAARASGDAARIKEAEAAHSQAVSEAKAARKKNEGSGAVASSCRPGSA